MKSSRNRFWSLNWSDVLRFYLRGLSCSTSKEMHKKNRSSRFDRSQQPIRMTKTEVIVSQSCLLIVEVSLRSAVVFSPLCLWQLKVFNPSFAAAHISVIWKRRPRPVLQLPVIWMSCWGGFSYKHPGFETRLTRPARCFVCFVWTDFL